MQCIPTQILVRRGICGDRRALWNESEYGEDIAVPDQKKTAKISGTTGNRLIDGERDESGDEGDGKQVENGQDKVKDQEQNVGSQRLAQHQEIL